MAKRALGSTVPVSMLAGAGVLASAIAGHVHPPAPPQGLEAHETHASASLLGQFRTSASSWLWLRTDLYLHNGVEMRPLTKGEVEHGHEGAGSREDGHEALTNCEHIVTVVPEASKDFRGVLGDVERAVSPYRDMHGHKHRDPGQALPFFRLMTWLDPQFVMAWVTGATVMAREASEEGTRKALEFLAEAERHNPRSVAIPTESARLLLSRRKDLRGAKPFLEMAMRRGADASEKLPEIESEGLQLACRLLALVYRDLGEGGKLERHLGVWSELFPDDPMLKRVGEAVKSKALERT